ncbi:helix-turn-helix domain-containing protein [Methanoculleus sp. YWC-01]|uniref:Helix-turn-helix domain-containing protein n=1 Tax=Methanoculleus nereidis TaxID=2735141 RepID=A0ABU3YZQ9_9EURY|nr:helix-turn-helix domain-containing protein [Methanoculleus sp. YWC-01]
MPKAYRYRLRPTRFHVSRLERTLEICRWTYNETLALRKNAWEQEGRSISCQESKRQIPLWKKEHSKPSTVYSQVLQDVSMRVYLALSLLPAGEDLE